MKRWVELSAQIDYGQPRRVADVDARNVNRNDGKERQHHRAQDRGDDKKLRAHTLQVLTLDDGEQFSHDASPTFSMKISCRLGSTSSNLLTTAPFSTNRLSSD